MRHVFHARAEHLGTDEPAALPLGVQAHQPLVPSGHARATLVAVGDLADLDGIQIEIPMAPIPF